MIDKAITNPGFHKQFQLDRFNGQEKKILRLLSRGWYLTNSGAELRIAQSRYNYFLMKPTPNTSEMFNIEREIICVFSDYDYFEPRALDFFELVKTRLPKMRTETVCAVLIGNARDTESKVEHLLKSDPEHQIIVPVSYYEMMQDNALIILENKFRKHFYSRDLFSFLSPLKKDTYFFGRSGLINEIVNRFKSGEHTSLFGLRKSGKTSIVYALQRRLEMNGDCFVSLDCESPSIHGLRWNELLERLVRLYQEAMQSKLNIDTSGRYDSKNAADSFECDIQKIYNSNKNSGTVFIFDEIERITPKTGASIHWREDSDFIYFWQTMRGFYQKHPSIFCYMLVGTNPSCIEAPSLLGHDNPIYASIPSQYVPSFTVEQVRQMVSRLGDYMGLKFDALIAAKLTEDYGGHPFLIRQACSQINKLVSAERPLKIDKTLYNHSKEEFRINSQEYLEMMIHVLAEWYPDEYEMLCLLAQDDKQKFNAYAQENISYTRHLVGYGLIQKGSSGYSFNFEEISDLLRKKHSNERLNLNDDEKVQEVSIRRNRLEKGMRVLIRNSLRISKGSNKAKDSVIAAVPEGRRAMLINYDLPGLLDRDSSPLFLLELINIIKREWPSFENIFDNEKAKIILMLEEINATGRPDAHAKYVNEDDFQQLRLYFKKLESILQEWL
ncbi:ATP-binding protein [Citrobacter koseri]|uniref:ATP-binding protein n=1 Tax=Citrobacter koseri TaxID=545 RepID=UPI0028BEBDC0|nr:ATP-binding protein [Citrobacter koseri]MDT7460014.1 ATP-binding protein [Citrobacter koseri]